MNREIKFRAWDKVSWVMKYWDEYSPPTQLLEDALYPTPDEDLGFKENYVLMQFTGLYDKNGKEIYENDMVKCWVDKHNYILGVIKWEHAGFVIDYISTGEDPVTPSAKDSFPLPNGNAMYVLGNLFEDPKNTKETLNINGRI